VGGEQVNNTTVNDILIEEDNTCTKQTANTVGSFIFVGIEVFNFLSQNIFEGI